MAMATLFRSKYNAPKEQPKITQLPQQGQQIVGATIPRSFNPNTPKQSQVQTPTVQPQDVASAVSNLTSGLFSNQVASQEDTTGKVGSVSPSQSKPQDTQISNKPNPNDGKTGSIVRPSFSKLTSFLRRK